MDSCTKIVVDYKLCVYNRLTNQTGNFGRRNGYLEQNREDARINSVTVVE